MKKKTKKQSDEDNILEITCGDIAIRSNKNLNGARLIKKILADRTISNYLSYFQRKKLMIPTYINS